MTWIQDIIYRLKMDEGSTITLINRVASGINRETGVQSIVETECLIPMAVEIPVSMRQAFLKSVGIHKVGYLEFGEQEFLIDSNDLDGFIITPETRLDTNKKRYHVKSIEEYNDCLIVIGKAYGDSIVRTMNLTETLILNDGFSNE